MSKKRNKKLPHEIDTEELLNLVDSKEEFVEEAKNEITEDEHSILAFLSFYNIKHGNEKIPCTLLYEIYKRWAKEKISKDLFFKSVSLYLIRGKTGVHNYYQINMDALTLSKKALDLLKKKPNRTKSKTAKVHFDSFLSHYKITKGTDRVGLEYLYKLYDKWHYEKKPKSRLGKGQLKKFLRLYFDYKISNGQDYYRIRINEEKKEQKR